MSRMPLIQKILLLLLTSLAANQAQAFYAQSAAPEKQDERCKGVDQDDISSHYFAPYEVNSFMLKETSGDDPASEINVSLRYYFISQTETGDNCKTYHKAMFIGANPFFSYTGKYDFYWWPVRETRPSAPVISRYQNPAVHLRYNVKPDYFLPAGSWGDIGLEHISNGQALTALNNQATIRNAYLNNDNAVMDSISRVGAMAALTLEGNIRLGDNSDFALKWYAHRFRQEADVYWGPYANQGVDFNSFQRVKAQWRIKYNGLNLTRLPWQFSAELNVGALGLSEDSWNFMLNTPFRIDDYEIPLAFTAHRGPMNNLSDYTRAQNTFAFGFAFAY